MAFPRQRSPATGTGLRSGAADAERPALDAAAPRRAHAALGNLTVRRLALSVSAPHDAVERQAEGAASRAADGTRAAGERPTSRGAALAPSGASRALIAALGEGRPLARSERASLEASLGGDLGHVRIHDGAEAASAAAQLRSRAFTVGDHVAFGAGEYQPASREGWHLLGHELAHTLQPGGPDVRRAPIPAAAPLADFVGLTQVAIDGIDAASALTVGPEIVMLLQGLRAHISLRTSTGSLAVDGGSLVLDRSNTVPPVSPPIGFRLIVDDTATPTLGAGFSAGSVVMQAGHFRGGDTDVLGDALFHEMVHALLFLHRERPSLTFRQDVVRALDPTRHAHFVSILERQLDRLFPGDARNARVAAGLVEEIVAIVETEVHAAKVDGQPGIPMPRDEFVHAMRAHLFGAGLFYTTAEGATVAREAGGWLADLLEVLFRYYTSWTRRRRFETAVFGEGMRF